MNEDDDTLESVFFFLVSNYYNISAVTVSQKKPKRNSDCRISLGLPPTFWTGQSFCSLGELPPMRKYYSLAGAVMERGFYLIPSDKADCNHFY